MIENTATSTQPFTIDGLSSSLMVGIGGAGMKALAEYLLDAGWTIRGIDSDTGNPTLNWLRDRGIRIEDGRHSEFLTTEADFKIDLLIRSAAVSENSPEVAFAIQAGIPVVSYHDMLGVISRKHKTISIAGTHGKSTTASMVAHLLQEARRNPSAIFGAELLESGRSGWKGAGKHLVLESCEYRRNFLSHFYKFGAILNIENDHFDYYENIDDLHNAFREYASHCRPHGLLLISSDCRVVLDDAKVNAEIQTFSLTKPADWTATNIEFVEDGSSFDVSFQEKLFCRINLSVKSRHFIQNALAAVAIAARDGLSDQEIVEGFASYRGLRRRFELLGSWNEIAFLSDYAHHPTEIQATLDTARLTFPQRRIVAVFQPHQASRTAHLMSEFGDALAGFDATVLVPVFAARENRTLQHESLSQELSEEISLRETTSDYSASLDHLPATLEDVVREGDVVIFMGAGDLYRIQNELIGKLQRDYH